MVFGASRFPILGALECGVPHKHTVRIRTVGVRRPGMRKAEVKDTSACVTSAAHEVTADCTTARKAFAVVHLSHFVAGSSYDRWCGTLMLLVACCTGGWLGGCSTKEGGQDAGFRIDLHLASCRGDAESWGERLLRVKLRHRIPLCRI